MTNGLRLLLLASFLLAVAACSFGTPKEQIVRQDFDKKPTTESDTESVFGEGGLLGGRDRPDEGGGIGVNSFLWRASLDTVSFMPLVSADPFGGVIITDWYSPPQSPNERFKVNVYILGRTLRADGVRAAVFRQELAGSAGWVDSPVASNTATDLENAILLRARELRIAQGGEGS